VRPWLFAGSVATFLATAALYGAATFEGRGAVLRLQAVLSPEPPLDGPTLLEPAPARAATLHWIAADGLWTAQRHMASGELIERVEQLSNLVLDRLGVGLVVIQAIAGSDNVAYLFFSAPHWEPSPGDEAALAQSLTRTLLTDQPWLSGVRLVLAGRHVDLRRPLRHFDRRLGALFDKPRSTGSPALRLAEQGPDERRSS
jgi:hypothetical protein